jgi:hypothetical protein
MYWLLSLLLLGTPLVSGAFPLLAAPTGPAPLDQCRLRLRLDPRTGTVQAHGTWHVQAGPLPANLHFLLAPGLVVQAAQGPRVLGFSQRPGTRSGDTLTLRLRPSGQHVAPLRFHLAYAGRVAASPLPQAIHAWSASWLELTERLGLLPLRCQVPLTQRTTYSLHVELPPGYDLVGSGRVRRPRAGHWTLHQRATRQLGLFGAPGLARWRAPSPRGLAVWVVQPGAVDTIAQRLATLAVRAATFYNAQYGARRLRQLCLVIPPPSAQLSGQTWSYALPGKGSRSVVRVEPGANAEQMFYTIGHEVAHHWWHASPYPNSQFQSYLNEGFAEYACLSFYRATYGEVAFAALLARYRAIAETLPPVPEMAPDLPLKTRNQFIYIKTAYTLWLLETYLGQAAMRQLLRQAVREQPASHAAWLALVERSVGPPVRVFFEAHF